MSGSFVVQPHWINNTQVDKHMLLHIDTSQFQVGQLYSRVTEQLFFFCLFLFALKYSIHISNLLFKVKWAVFQLYWRRIKLVYNLKQVVGFLSLINHHYTYDKYVFEVEFSIHNPIYLGHLCTIHFIYV